MDVGRQRRLLRFSKPSAWSRGFLGVRKHKCVPFFYHTILLFLIMKKSVSFVALLFAVLGIMVFSPLGVTAQDDSEYTPIDRVVESFAYEYQLLRNAKDPASIHVVQMSLEIGERHSKFYETSRVLFDSLWLMYRPDMQRFVNALLSNPPGDGNILTHFCVYKNFPNRGDLLFHGNPEIETMYVVEQEQPIVEWELVPESDTLIATHRCQMARGSYGGREWRAWYTMEIPINDGPYKFSGLPGLIVRVADADNEHIFQLRGRGNRIGGPLFMVTEEPKRSMTAEEYAKMMKTVALESFRQLTEGMTMDSESMERIRRNTMKNSNFIER